MQKELLIFLMLFLASCSTPEQRLAKMNEIADNRGCIDGYQVSVISPSSFTCQNIDDLQKQSEVFPQFYPIKQYKEYKDGSRKWLYEQIQEGRTIKTEGHINP